MPKMEITIQTAFKKLVTSFQTNETIRIDMIKYSDQEKFQTKLGNIFNIFSKKEEKDLSKKELRLIILGYIVIYSKSKLWPVNLMPQQNQFMFDTIVN